MIVVCMKSFNPIMAALSVLMSFYLQVLCRRQHEDFPDGVHLDGPPPSISAGEKNRLREAVGAAWVSPYMTRPCQNSPPAYLRIQDHVLRTMNKRGESLP